MIKSWLHKDLKHFFETGNTKEIQAKHKNKLQSQLTVLNVIESADEIILPSWKLHTLKGKYKDHYSIKVNGNWRLTFKFDDEDVVLLNYVDYH